MPNFKISAPFELRALSDIAAAVLIRAEGATTAAVDERIEAVAASIIASDPTILSGALALVDEAIVERDLISASDPRIDRLIDDPRVANHAWTDFNWRASLYDRPDAVIVAPAGIETPRAGMELPGSPYQAGGTFDPISRKFDELVVDSTTKQVPQIVLDAWKGRMGFDPQSGVDSWKLDAHLITGTGSASGTGMTSTQDTMMLRVPFKPFCTYNGFWVELQNRNIRLALSYGAINVQGIWIGPHFMPLGVMTGYMDSVTQLSGSFTVPAGGASVKFWVPPSIAKLARRRDYILSIAYTSAVSGQVNQSGPGLSFQSAFPEDGGVAGVTPHALTRSKYSPLRVVLRPMIPSNTPVLAWVTDSHGLATNAENSLYGSFPVRHAFMHGVFPRMYSYHGIKLKDMLDYSDEKWGTFADLGPADGAVLQDASNDVFEAGGTQESVSTIMANYSTVVGIIRDHLTPNIWGMTVLPRNGSATSPALEARRVDVNERLTGSPSGVPSGIPNGLLGVVDAAAAVESPTTPGTVRTGSMSTDSIHLSDKGENEVTQRFPGPMATRDQ